MVLQILIQGSDHSSYSDGPTLPGTLNSLKAWGAIRSLWFYKENGMAVTFQVVVLLGKALLLEDLLMTALAIVCLWGTLRETAWLIL